MKKPRSDSVKQGGSIQDSVIQDSLEPERTELLAQIEELGADIRRRTRELLARADSPEFFKNHPVAKEVAK